MAAFPSYVKLGLGTSLNPEQGWKDTVSDGGTLHSRQLHGSTYYGITVIWPGATGQQVADLTALYESAPRDVMTGFTYYLSSPTLTLDVVFMEPPRIIRNYGGDKYDVQLSLRGS